MTKIVSLALIGVVITAACSSLNPRNDRPAVIVRANEHSRIMVQQAIANMLHGARVEIANSALTETSELAIHRTLLSGRDLGGVDNFQLVSNRGNCYLIHLNTQAREALSSIECAELSSD
ncbi:MAG: hypothetical protein HOL48_01980 [Porticoccaceae bacterium]|mgnify:FL=1|nr:hypothetical protein [Porticoccaceae bacterium]